jgi:hypothetical protein
MEEADRGHCGPKTKFPVIPIQPQVIERAALEKAAQNLYDKLITQKEIE